MEPAPVAKPPQKPLPSSAIHPTPPLSFSVDDADLDDCLDDNEFTAEEQEEAVTAVAMAAYRPPPTPEAAKNLSKVANAVASCSALSFFSISMILANKVRVSAPSEEQLYCRLMMVVVWFCFADIYLLYCIVASSFTGPFATRYSVTAARIRVLVLMLMLLYDININININIRANTVIPF